MYTLRAVSWHDNVIARCDNLVDAISIKTLHSMRYGFDLCIFDADDYLVGSREQCAALEAVYAKHVTRHPSL